MENLNHSSISHSGNLIQKMGHSEDEKAKKPNKDGEATQKLTTAGSQDPSRAVDYGISKTQKPGPPSLS